MINIFLLHLLFCSHCNSILQNFLSQGYSTKKFMIDFKLRNTPKIPIRCILALLFLQLAYICQAMF